MSRNRIGALAFALLVVVFLSARIYIAQRESLWADELYTLSVTTGHSIWQLPEQTRPDLGDYFDPPRPQAAAVYRKYINFEPGIKLPENIVRACILVDWNSPIYYLIQWIWLRAVGISELNLRLPSILMSLATLPFIWLIAEKLGGSRSAWIGCLIFTLNPASLYFSTEGRVYAFTLFFSTLLMYLTISLRDQAGSLQKRKAIIWTLIAGIALLCHILLASVFVACVLWLLLFARNIGYKRLALMVGGALVVALSWHVRLVHAMSENTLATKQWFGVSIPWWFELSRPVSSVLSFISSLGTENPTSFVMPGISLFVMLPPLFLLCLIFLPMMPTILPVSNKAIFNVRFTRLWAVTSAVCGALTLMQYSATVPPECTGLYTEIVFIATLCALPFLWILSGRLKFGEYDPRHLLLYLNVTITTLVPLLLDITEHAPFCFIQRYYLPAFPAIILLVTLAISRLKLRTQVIFAALGILLWAPLWTNFLYSTTRHQEDYRAIGEILKESRASDLILIHHRFPPSALGVADYLTVDKELASWSDESGVQKIPDDLVALVKGRTAVYFVKGRDRIYPSPAEDWLRKNARLEKEFPLPYGTNSQILYFVPLHKTFGS